MKYLTFNSEVRVRFNETDALGIVWHGNYIKYFEDAREAFGREFNLSYLSIKDEGFSTPIVETQLFHKLPLKYGDVCTIEAKFIDNDAAKITFMFKVFNEENKVVCTGKSVQVFVDENGDLSLNLPEFFVKWKESMKFKTK